MHLQDTNAADEATRLVDGPIPPAHRQQTPVGPILAIVAFIALAIGWWSLKLLGLLVIVAVAWVLTMTVIDIARFHWFMRDGRRRR